MDFRIKYKIIANRTHTIPLSRLPIVVNPTLPNILTYLETKPINSVSARVSIADITIEFSFNLPALPIHLNPNTEAAEASVWPHCEEYGLYVGEERKVKAAKFAWLPGLVDPTLSLEGLVATSTGFLDLFVHDDDIDSQSSKPDFSRLKPDNLRFVQVSEGAPIQETDKGKVKGYKNAIDSFFSKHLTANNSPHYIDSLQNYLQSTEVEMTEMSESHPDEKVLPSYSAYLENRRDTSGIFHAISMMWVGHDLNTNELLKNNYILKTLLKETCDLVCRLNDVASAKKELNSFAKYAGLNEVVTLADSEAVKPFITANSVLLKFREGKTLQEATDETIGEYNDILKGFIANASRLNGQCQINPELNLAVQILFGWVMGHAAWAGISKRYNLEIVATAPLVV